MKKLFNSILVKDLLYPTFLLMLVASIFFANYTSGTWLSGWDTLHPEFDFPAHIAKAFFGVFRPDQGLGAIAGHSHMADLPRIVILWILHFITPLQTVHYGYVFLTMIMAVLGMYILLRKMFQKHDLGSLIAFLGSAFYLLNLGTLQQYYVVFDMFPTQLAYLPWIIYFTIEFLTKGSKKYLFLFSLATLLATPQAYAAQLWYAFFGTYCTALFLWAVKKPQYLKKIAITILLLLSINSFWLLPNLYYAKTQSAVSQNAKQNRLFSQEYQLKNREQGFIQDVALVKGFYFDWDIYSFSDKRFVNLMAPWQQHLANPFVALIGYLGFSIVVLGLLDSIRKKDTHAIILTPFLIIPAILLLNHTPPFEQFFNLITSIPILKEALRFVFTKFSILLTFAYAIYFAFGIAYLFSIRWLKGVQYSFASFVVLLLVLYMSPAWRGLFISPSIRVEIPSSYFKLYDHMKNKPKGRILQLPLASSVGWNYYSWGYQGSGFIWFGINMPILDRDSDRWETSNEQAFREFQHALYSSDENLFSKMLDKYNISYILWDTSVTAGDNKNSDQITFQREINQLLDSLARTGTIGQEQDFSPVTLFQVNQKEQVLFNGYSSLPSVSPSYTWSHQDSAYTQHGPYYSDLDIPGDLFYPFRDYMNTDNTVKSSSISLDIRSKKFSISPPRQEFPLINVTDTQNQVKDIATSFSGDILPFYKEYSSTDLFKTYVPDAQDTKEITHDGKSLHLTSLNQQTGLSIDLSDLSHQYGYVIAIESANKKGLPLRFCFKNFYSKLCDLYDEVPRHEQIKTDYFIVAPTDLGLGYSLSIDNLSFGKYPSVNTLVSVGIYPIPYEYLSSMYYQKSDATTVSVKDAMSYKYLYPYSYRVQTVPNMKYISLDYSFNNGWLAYHVSDNSFLNTYFPFIRGKKIDDHVLINNWANGWKIPSSTCNLQLDTCNNHIVIFFWPQYLQYLGFILLGFTFVGIVLYKKQNTSYKKQTNLK